MELEVVAMTKEDYREKVEEHRQEIDLHNESGAKISRVARNRKGNAKKQKNPLMKILVVVFIFIPLSILGYVLFIFDPGTKANDTTKANDNDQLVEIQKQDPNESKVVDSDNEADEKNDAQADAAEKERLAAEKAKAAEAQKLEDEKKAKEAEEAQKVAAQKAKELEAKKKVEAERAKAEAEKANTARTTHTVQSTDNLYRIALKYYGDGSPANIEKIKAANNLTSDSISAGQVLVIIQ